LSHEESVIMVKHAQAGDKRAAARLLASCERQIWKHASRYAGKSPHLVEDMVAESRIRVFLMIEKFDPTRGMKFNSYAMFGIRNACSEVWQSQRSVVTLPVVRTRHGTEREESLKRVQSHSIVQIGASGEETEMPITAREPTETDVFARERLMAAIEKLPPRERAVIRGRFFGDRTLDEISNDHGVSRERVRQIEVRALWELRQALEFREVVAPITKKSPRSISRFSGALQELRQRGA
jgi:RNA polymerase sigma factor (sigma-70 family)